MNYMELVRPKVSVFYGLLIEFILVQKFLKKVVQSVMVWSNIYIYAILVGSICSKSKCNVVVHQKHVPLFKTICYI